MKCNACKQMTITNIPCVQGYSWCQGEKMKQPLIAVYDRKTNTYDNPFTVRHVAEAIRDWDMVSKDKNTKIGKNPEDFSLVQIGEYDLNTGLTENKLPHIHLTESH